MKKMYVPAFVTRFAFFILVLMLSASRIFAQVDIVIGTGTAGNGIYTYPCPIQDWYEGSRAQYLYTAAELTAAGMSPGAIVGVKYNALSIGTAAITEQFTLKIGSTNITTLNLATWVPGTSTVYGPINYQPLLGNNSLLFSNSFFWNGTDNIIIETCGGDPNSTAGITYTPNAVFPWTTGLTFNGSHTYRDDNLDNLCGSAVVTNTGTATTRPNIIFSWVSASPCGGIPNPGISSASVSNACLGLPFNLKVTGQSVASGLTYQWQSSTDNTSFIDITGAIASQYTTSQSATSYYRCVVSCSNAGGGSANSSSVQVNSPALVSGTFTINSLLPTAGTNFNSFNAAYDYIKCGINAPVTFNVVGGSGPYNEQLIMSPVPGTSDINTVTFNGNGETISFLSSNTIQRAVIKLNGADYIRFNDLTISALGSSATEYGFGIHLINNADSNIFNNCIINIDKLSTLANYAGIVVSATDGSATTTGAALCDYNLFSNNTINGGFYGISIVGSTTDANGNNSVVNNTINDYYSYGVYVLGSFNLLVERNKISRPTRIVTTVSYGIYFTGLSVAANISKNKISNPYGGATSSITAAYGIYFTANDGFSGFENLVSNNVIYNFTGNGDVYGIYNNSSDNVFYYHNTISIDGSAPNTTSLNVSRGFYQTTLAAGIEFKNNIVSISRAGVSIKTGIYFATPTSTIVSNYNNFYINTIVTSASVGFFNVAQASLANWKTAATQDANSISINPIFSSIASGNYIPTNASVDNLGSPVFIFDDIDGNVRSATKPDIGAYEVTPGVCPSPATSGTSLISASTVCQGSGVTLGLTGNSIGLGQVYQWQTSSSPSGPFTPIGNVLTNPDTSIVAPGNTLYYSVSLTCGASTVTSVPVLLNINPSLLAGTYTIDKTQPTGGTNYNSFAAAKAALECGILGPVVFNVVSGTGPYDEQLVLDSIIGTSAINTITFNGNANVIRYAPIVNSERAVIKLRRADYIIFNNLIINAAVLRSSFGYGVQLINNADNNTFKNCTILTLSDTTSINYVGIVINAIDAGSTTTGSTLCDGNLFSENTIIGGYYGVTLVGSTTDANRSNSFISNTVKDFYNYGFYVSYSYDTRIEGNDISRPIRAAGTNFYGIYSTGVSVGTTITRNRIHNPFGGFAANNLSAYGVYLTGVDGFSGLENRVTNNLIYDMNANLDVYGLYNASSDNTFYYHNTISLDEIASISTGVARGFYQTTTAAGIELKNNIITIRRGGSGNKHALYFATNGSGIISNYNDIFLESTGGVSAVGFFNAANRLTLADWQTVSTQDANSYTYNPEYTNPTTGDYTPLMTAMDNLGSPVGVNNDILNTTRSTITPDLGAYEFTIPLCTAPPSGGTTVVDPPSGICIGVTVKLDLAGNSFGAGQSYQWQVSPDGINNWTNIGSLQYISRYYWTMTTDTYFRCQISCSSLSAYSSVFQVLLNPALPSGYYTIDPTLPAVLPNFQSFASAVASLECGIAGFVTFDAAPGIYTEQIRMHRVGGAGPNARVTFRSASGVPASVTLAYSSTAAATNYTLLLDSASYISYQNITIQALGATYGRAVQLAHTASYDSITNCDIVAPGVITASVNTVGLYAALLAGNNDVINRNRFDKGSYGIYFEGISDGDLSKNHTIDSNVVNGAYQYGIYTSLTSRIKLTRNTINLASPHNNTAYALYCTNCDTGYVVTGNNVNFNNTIGTVYGIYLTGCDANAQERAKVASNTIIASDVNASVMYGLYETNSGYNNTVNNVISIKTTGASSYGIYSTSDFQNNYYNNSVNSRATSATNNVAAYFNHTSGTTGKVKIKNNIFSHNAGGVALQITNNNFLYSDYNFLYTTGAVLVKGPTANYANLSAWANASFWDVNSMSYRPAFISNTNLRPNLNDPDVWAIHGRGVQIDGNDYDFDANARPTTLTTGVPDMGAFEFLPTSLPTTLTAIAPPAPGTTQTFMYGTDTVIKVTYAAGSTVPTDLTFRRYSGVIPPGLSPAQQSMYFYTEAQVTGSQPSNFSIKKFYIDPWQGFIPDQLFTKLGKTDLSNTWLANTNSNVEVLGNFITDTSLNYMDKFTGLRDSNIVTPPVILPPADSSNRGKKFWVGYGHHYGFEYSNDQDMKLYLSAEQSANVVVKINGTSYVRNYFVAAGTVFATEALPKTGIFDARLLIDGISDRGISIESDVPIVAYGHIFASTTSEAAMLLPVGTYGYEYTALTTPQQYATNTYSWAYVIAEVDSTVVEITPSNRTLSGRPAAVPFNVTLNKGEIYQVLGAIISGSIGYDLTGTTFKSRPNSSGKCYPIAVFSGSSRTSISCGGGSGSSGDNIFEQNFPYVAWGKRYLTTPTSLDVAANSLSTNIFRVAIKDPTTVVTRNGVALTGLINNFYYQYESNTADVIKADKPVIVAQIMSSSSACPNTSGDGDPAMIYVSPVEQGIKRVGLYRTTQSSIDEQYVTLIVPTPGLASLTIDGSNVFSYTYVHPNDPNYTVVVKRWAPATNAQVIINCDSAFTAITYGLGGVESYGYNAGTLVKNLNAVPALTNSLGNGNPTNYTCAKAPFNLSLSINLHPTQMEWILNEVPGISPNTNVTVQNPVAIDSTFINEEWFYTYSLLGTYSFSTPGSFVIPINVTHPSIEGCNNILEVSLPITVIPAPFVNFNDPLIGCTGQTLSFNGIANSSSSSPVISWSWDFGNPPGSGSQDTTHVFNTGGTYNVKLSVVTADGCLGDTTKVVIIGSLPVVTITPDSINICSGEDTTISVTNPAPGVTYSWYTNASGGSPIATGISYTATNVTSTQEYFVEGVIGSCVSEVREQVVISIVLPLATTVVSVDSVGSNFVAFSWTSVSGAVGYEVSIDAGTTWISPSSGATGLSHIVRGLTPLQTVTLFVRALGITACQTSSTDSISGTTIANLSIFIPNAFTPNGDGLNDVMQVYGSNIKSLRFVVFNQWGEKIIESTNSQNVWDGRQRGKPQPSGVYMYVCEMIMNDGTKILKKGSINLIR